MLFSLNMSVIENNLTQITRTSFSMTENSCEFSEIPETTGKSYFIESDGGGWGRGVASRLRKYIYLSMLAFLCTNPPGHSRYHSNNTGLRLLPPRTPHIGVENSFYDFFCVRGITVARLDSRS